MKRLRLVFAPLVLPLWGFIGFGLLFRLIEAEEAWERFASTPAWVVEEDNLRWLWRWLKRAILRLGMEAQKHPFLGPYYPDLVRDLVSHYRKVRDTMEPCR
jgi:hypothetical protein